MKQKVRSTPGRVLMKFLCTVLGLLLVVMLGGSIYANHQLSQINYVNQKEPGELLEFLKSGGSGQEEGSEGLMGGKGSGVVNIMLIGQDRRENEGRTRSDTMILCTFNKKTKTLTMTSFLRDLYVAIPGYGSNRLNSAYAFGGMDLLDKTISQNFQVHVDGNVEVDFSQFAQIVDALGGVEMELRQDEAEFINYETGSEYSAGTWVLSGDQALAYSRIRKLDADGDFSRTNRQRKVLSAILDSYRSASLPQMLSMTTQILPMITTDMSNMQILGHAMELFPMLSGLEIVSSRIPAAGTFSNQNIDGMAVLVPDLEANRQVLQQCMAVE